MWHFHMFRLLLSFETPNAVRSVAYVSKNIQATSKGSDQSGICAGWSEPLLVAYTTLLEILCCGSFCLC